MKSLLVGLILCFGLVACGGNPPPSGPPDPPPSECLPGVSWCHDFDPPRTCSTEAEPCKHNPSTDPAYCELAGDCPPDPPDPPTDPPPPQHPDNLPCPPRAGEAGWEVVSPKPQAPTSKLVAVNEAIKTLKREKPEMFDRAGNCLAGWTGGKEGDVFFYELALVLARTNDCAGQFIEDGGKRVDALGVLAGGRQDWLEMHLVYYGDGCILPVANAYKNTWHDNVPYVPPGLPDPQCEGFVNRGGMFQTEECDCWVEHTWNNCDTDPDPPTDPDPDPPDPPVGGCTDPDPRGLSAEFTLHCGQGNGTVCDSTFRVVNRQYCDAVCSPSEPDVCFTGRTKCPMRMEGDPERHACYDAVVAPQKWWCDGVEISAMDNPARARCVGIVKTCTADGATCSEKDAR